MTPDVDLFSQYDRMAVLEKSIFKHSTYRQALERIEEIHERSVKTKRSEYLFVVGESGVGKSTLLSKYAEKYPRYVEGKTTVIPVLMLSVPGASSMLALANAVLESFGRAYVTKGKSWDDKWNQVIRLINSTKVQLIIFDEMHNFVSKANRNEEQRLIDSLKNLMNKTSVAIVAAGIPDCLKLVDKDPQLRTRMTAEVSIERFDVECPELYADFKSILFSLERALGYPEPSILYEEPLAQRIYFACDGNFRMLIKLLREAIGTAERLEESSISQAILYQAFKRAFREDTPDEANPFSEVFYPRRLTGKGEAHGQRRG